MSDDNKKGGLVLLGRDISTIPCYRDSLITGICGGVVSGLGFFLFTSHPRRATHFGFMSFIGVSLVAWTVCRSRRQGSILDEETIRKALQAKILSEGTSLEEKIKSESKDV